MPEPKPKPPQQWDNWLDYLIDSVPWMTPNDEYRVKRAKAELAALRERTNRSGWDAYDALRSRVEEGSRIIQSALTESWNAVVDKVCDEPRKDDDDDTR